MYGETGGSGMFEMLANIILITVALLAFPILFSGPIKIFNSIRNRMPLAVRGAIYLCYIGFVIYLIIAYPDT